MMRFQVLGSVVLGSWIGCCVPDAPAIAQAPEDLLQRAVAQFEQARFSEAVDSFDALARARRDLAPHLWQRGIALYYAKRYGDCRAQFESHRSVNPDDVENAAWHFLCVARHEGAQSARAALLPVGPDSRVPMREVYEMFRGRLEPSAVLVAAGSRPEGLFYAHLYVGLYLEATGKRDVALAHIKEAANPRYARIGGYMHMVATVHLRTGN
jgi:lipoprotein NlpI